MECKLLGLLPQEGHILLGEVKQGVCSMGVILEKLMVKVAESKEGLELFDHPGCRPMCDGSEFGWVHLEASFCNNDAEVFDRCLCKHALFWFEVQIMILEACKDFMGKFVKVSRVIGKYQDVIQVNYDMSFINHVSKNIVHEHLEGSWGIAESKGHPVMTLGSNNPKGVLKAALYASPSLMCMLLYPHHISNLVKYHVPCNLLINSGIKGSGAAFLIVTSFRAW